MRQASRVNALCTIAGMCAACLSHCWKPCPYLQSLPLHDHCTIVAYFKLSGKEEKEMAAAGCARLSSGTLYMQKQAEPASMTKVQMAPSFYLKEGEGMTAAHADLQQQSPSARIAAGTASGAAAPALAAPQIQPSSAAKQTGHLSYTMKHMDLAGEDRHGYKRPPLPCISAFGHWCSGP